MSQHRAEDTPAEPSGGRERLRARLEAGEPIRVGIVGLSAHGGWAARAHLPALRALPEYEVTALAASTPERAAEAGAAHGVATTFGDVESLAQHDEVDLVVVAVRVPAHRELVAPAIAAGKAVFCEWPLGRDLAEAREMAAAARDAGVATGVGLQARSAPAVRYLRDLVAQGRIGEVLSATLVGSGGTWGVSIPDAGRRYLWEAANGASMFTIPFGHTLDGLASVLGEPRFTAAQLVTRRFEVLDVDSGEQWPVDTADQVVAAATLPGGAVLATHYRGGTSRATNLHWEINGTEGDLVLDGDTGHLQMADPSLSGAWGDASALTPIEVPASYHLPQPLPGPAVNVAHAYRGFAEDLRTGGTTTPDFDSAVRRHESLQQLLDLAGGEWGTRGA